MVAGWIGAAYWFTSSPAITIARSLSNTFTGIAPSHVPAFVLAQLLGATAAIPIARILFGTRRVVGAAKATPSARLMEDPW